MPHVPLPFQVISSLLFLALGTAAFVEYPAKSAILIILILWPLTSILASLIPIPIVGQIAYWLVAKKFLYPTFFEWFPEVSPSWVSETIFWLGLAYSIIMPFVFIAMARSSGIISADREMIFGGYQRLPGQDT